MDRLVEGEVAIGDQMRMTDTLLQCRAGDRDGAPLGIGRAQRCEMGGARLGDKTKLDEIEGMIQRALDFAQPEQYVGIEQIPFGTRPHAGAEFGSDRDEVLAGEHLDRLAQQVAADTKRRRQLGLYRQRTLTVVTTQDSRAELIDDLAEDGAWLVTLPHDRRPP